MEGRNLAARLLVLFVGRLVWMLVIAKQGEASPVHMIDRKLQATGDSHSYGSQAMTYIVYMDKSFTVDYGAMGTSSPLSRYSQLLQTMKQQVAALDDAEPVPAIIYHVYSSVCHGFTTSLTSLEAAALRKMNGVLGVYPDTINSLHTTRTPEFLGLSNVNGLWLDGHFGDDVIVGVLDSGVWPESASFSDADLGPVPARWKGGCDDLTGNADFNASHCNKKLIGARYFVAGYEAWLLNATGKPLNESVESRSPRDTEGHGTHTASTAAGSPTPGASLFGLANGTARGMAPKARVAVYKICWAGGCFGSDILAAFDQAVADGVDVISISVGGDASDYNIDPIAIGAFWAIQKGVFVSASAGNSGPELQTVSNVAPWMMTVAASTLDRNFAANVILGDGQIIRGQSLYVGVGGNATEMITGADASATGNVTASALCMPGTLSPALVKGKIVLCERGPGRVAKGAAVLAAGGAGMILYNTGANGGVIADAHLLPATHVDTVGGTALLAYMRRNTPAVARFEFLGTQYNVKPAPVVAGFSSRGPSFVTPQVAKPDITAPGVAILAAWTGAAGPSPLLSDTRRVAYNIISGTSMSCPHVSGLGAVLKAAHPDWSPAAIRSAMMTTASIHDSTQVDIIRDEYGDLVQATPLQYGSGHVRPQLALDPGLVYDMKVQDYVDFLCASNYTALDIFSSSPNATVSCPLPPIRVEDLNYPSFAAVFQQPPSAVTISMNMTRTVTNVGHANATYKAQIVRPADTQIVVYPDVLSFTAVNEKKSFTVQVSTVNAPSTSFGVSVIDFGFLVWTDGIRAVQSPISITVSK